MLWLLSPSPSPAETSLLVTRMQRRWPPSIALIKLTAFSVVPLPAKKSTTSAFGRFQITFSTQVFTAYNDFGNGKFRPMICCTNELP